ncbi:hypothetical protein GCM10029964_102170 [Kibdelosporangium lantanae]
MQFPTGDPHDVLVSAEGPLGGVGVGGLGVVDVLDAVLFGDQLHAVGLGAEVVQALADRLGRDAVRAGEGGGGEGVAHVVQARWADLVDRAQRCVALDQPVVLDVVGP